MSGATIKFKISIPTETVQSYMDGLVRIEEAKSGSGKSFDWSTLLSAASFALPVITQMFSVDTTPAKAVKVPHTKVVRCPIRDPETGCVPQEIIDECRSKGMSCPIVKSTDVGEADDTETDEVVYGAEGFDEKSTTETKTKASVSEDSLPENMFTMFMNPEHMGKLMGNLKPLLETFRGGFDIEAQTDTQADTKTETKADTKTETKADTKTETKTETKADDVKDVDTKPKTE